MSATAAKKYKVQPVPKAADVREAVEAVERGLHHLRGLCAALERVEAARAEEVGLGVGVSVPVTELAARP